MPPMMKQNFISISFAFLSLLQSACVSYPNFSDYPAVESARVPQKKCIDVSLDRYEDVFNEAHQLSQDQRIISKFKSELKIYNFDFECENPIKAYKIKIHSKNPKLALQFIWLTGTFLSLGVIPYYMIDKVFLTVKTGEKTLLEKEIAFETWVSIFLLPKMILSDRESHNLYHSRLNSAVINFQIAKVIHDDLNNKM